MSRLKIFSLVLVLACSTSCALGRVYATPYVCQVPERAPALSAFRPLNLPAGRFELKLLDGSDRGLERRLQVVADAIPLSTFVLRLGELIGQPMAVSHELVEARVSLSGTMTLMAVFDALRTTGVWSIGKSVTQFVSERQYREHNSGREDHVPVTVAIIPLRRPRSANQLAELACTMIAPGGSVAVVADNLVVRSFPEDVAKVRGMVAAFDSPLVPTDE